MKIAFEVAVARYLISGVLILGFTLLAFGCGGGGDRSAQAVEWGVSRQVGPRQIRLVTEIDHCRGPTPTIERPVIEYSGKRVFIELLLTPQEDSDHGGCLLQLLGVQKTVTLKRDLDELVLLDSSTNPPERRWPDY